MADIFISYKREDKPHAEQLRQVLEHYGFSVWFDAELLSGEEFRPVILEMIDKCSVVIVLWSAKAVKSQFVIDEAGYAQRKDKLCPAIIEPCDLPFGFGGMHADNLEDWEGQARHPGFNRLLESIEKKVGREARLGAPSPVTDSEKSEISDFQTVAKLRSAKAWKRFLADYPATSFRRFVEDQISELGSNEESMVSSALPKKNSNTLAILLLGVALIAVLGVSYVVWPRDSNLPQVTASADPAPSDAEELSGREAELWEAAESENTVYAYVFYLREFPYSKMSDLARIRQRELMEFYFDDGGQNPCFRKAVIYFAEDRSTLSSSTEISKLDQFVAWYRSNDNLCMPNKIAIEGNVHAPNVQSYDNQISQRMADNVKDALTARGIAPSRMDTKGFGRSQPLHPDWDNPANRRVEIIVQGTPINTP